MKTRENNGTPVPNAMVRIFQVDEQGASFIKEAATDATGTSERFALETPEKIHSVNISSEVKPYGSYDVHVAKNGYDTEEILGVQIFAETDSTLQVDMNQNPYGPNRNVTVIDEHQLRRGGR